MTPTVAVPSSSRPLGPRRGSSMTADATDSGSSSLIARAAGRQRTR